MTSTEVGGTDDLQGLAQEQAPVLEALARMHIDTLQLCNLEDYTYHLVRFAALAAIDAPPASYLVNVGMAMDAGLTVDDLRAALIAITPIIGSARVTAAAGNVLRAAGLAVALEEGED